MIHVLLKPGAVVGCNLKNDRMISVHFQVIPFIIIVLQIYAPLSNAEKVDVEWFYEDLQDFLELTAPPPKCPFHYNGLESESRKSRNTWSNSKFGPGAQNEAGRMLTEFCQENTLVIANTIFQ